MSDEPKTLQEQCYGTCWAATERISELERELAEAREIIETQKRVFVETDEATTERDQWREVAEELATGFRKLLDDCCMSVPPWLEKYDKLKEASNS